MSFNKGGKENLSAKDKDREKKARNNKEKSLDKSEKSRRLNEAGKRISDKMDNSSRGISKSSSIIHEKGKELESSNRESTLIKLKDELEKQNGKSRVNNQIRELQNVISKKELKSEVSKLAGVLFNNENIVADSRENLTDALVKIAQKGQITRITQANELASMDKQVVKEARDLAESMRPNATTFEKDDLTYAISKLVTENSIISRQGNNISSSVGESKLNEARESHVNDRKSLDEIAAKLVGSTESLKEKPNEKSEKNNIGIKKIEKIYQSDYTKEELEKHSENFRKLVKSTSQEEKKVDLEKELKKQGVVLHHETASKLSMSENYDGIETERDKLPPEKSSISNTETLKVELRKLKEDSKPQLKDKTDENHSEIVHTRIRRSINSLKSTSSAQDAKKRDSLGDDEPLYPEEWKEWMKRFDRPSDSRAGYETPLAPMSVIRGPSELSKALNDIKGFKLGNVPLEEAAKKLNKNGSLTVLVLPGQKILSFDTEGKITDNQANFWQGTIGGSDHPFIGIPSTNLPTGRTYVLHVSSGRIFNAPDGRELQGKLVKSTGESLTAIQEKGDYGIFYNVNAPSRGLAFNSDIKGQNLIVIRVPSPKEITPMRQPDMPRAPGIMGSIGYQMDEYIKVNEALKSSVKYLPESLRDTFSSVLSNIPDLLFSMVASPFLPNPILDASKRMGEVFSMARSAQTRDDIEVSAQLTAKVFSDATLLAALAAMSAIGFKVGAKISGKFKASRALREAVGKIDPEKPGLKMGRGKGEPLRQHLYKDGEHAKDFVSKNGMEETARKIELREERLVERHTAVEKRKLADQDKGDITSELAWRRTREQLENEGKQPAREPAETVNKMVREEEVKLNNIEKETLVNELAERRGKETAFLEASKQYNKQVIQKVIKDALKQPDTLLYRSEFQQHPDIGDANFGPQWNIEYTTKTGHRVRISWKEDGQILNALDILPEGTIIGKNPKNDLPLRVVDVRKVHKNPRFILGNEKKWLELNKRIDEEGKLISVTADTERVPLENAPTTRMEIGTLPESVDTNLFSFFKDTYYKGDANRAGRMLRNVYEFDLEQAIKSQEFIHRFNDYLERGDGSMKPTEALKIVKEVNEWYLSDVEILRVQAFEVVPIETIPKTWRNPMEKATEDVHIYRGFPRNIRRHAEEPIKKDIGGQASRSIDAAHDAVFNQYGKDPVLDGPAANRAGVVEITIPKDIWNLLAEKRHISERTYGGFKQRIKSSEIRINTEEAADILNKYQRRVIDPDPHYDYRDLPHPEIYR